MTEEERINKINKAAKKHLEDVLMQIESGELDGDDLIAVLYGYLVAAALMGYSPESLIKDVIATATKLMECVEETENEQE